MQNLEKRVALLEQASPTIERLTIIRSIVDPGRPTGEIFSLRDDCGKLWTRHTGETEQALIDRAALEVKRPAWGVARLVEVD